MEIVYFYGAFKSLITVSETLQGLYVGVGRGREYSLSKLKPLHFNSTFPGNPEFLLKLLNLQNCMRSVMVREDFVFVTVHISHWPKK